MENKGKYKNYKYILFDWDGCLAKTLDIWLNAYRIAYSEYGVHPTDLEITHHFGDWEAPKYYGIEDIDGCFKKIDAMASNDLKKVGLYPGAKEVLQTLKDKKLVALLTSSARNIIDAALFHNKIRDYFSVVLTGNDVKEPKPHPEMIEKGLKILKGKKSEAIIIGDSRKDLEAGNNAGIDTILFYPKNHNLFYKLEELQGYKPTYTVNKLTDVLKVVGGEQ